MPAANFFKDLKLPLDASGNDVRDAYKKLAKQWHPDKNSEEGAEEKFKQVLAAYTHLQSDDRRETHARDIKRQQEAAAAPKPPPQPPPQANHYPKPPAANTNGQHQSSSHENHTSRSKSAKQQTSAPRSKPKNVHKNWWESFSANNTSKENNSSASKPKPNPKQPRHRTRFFMDSFMDFADPFDDILFSIFMIPPDRPAPKSKTKTDRFGNKLPKNVDNDIYDWKSATKTAGQMPDYQNYLDGDTEFSCHYCGLMMDMEMLRKHEPRCLRLGGKKANTEYAFNDEDVNAAYTGSSTPPGSTAPKPATRKIKCRWCGESFRKNVVAAHIVQCEHKETRMPSRGQAKPEWNNNFTEPEDDDPVESLFGARPRSAKINIDDFNPFTNPPRSTCLQCKVKYGLAAPNFCIH